MKTAFILFLFIASSSWAQEYYDIPRSKLSMVVPEGFTHVACTGYFYGSSHEKEQIDINQAYGTNYYNYVSSPTNDPNRSDITAYMALEKVKDLKISKYDARYTHHIYKNFDNLHAYTLIFGDSSFTIQVFMVVKINHLNTDPSIEKSLTGIKYDKNKKVDYFEKSGISYPEQKSFMLDDKSDPGLSTWRFLPVKRGKRLDRSKGTVIFSTKYFSNTISKRLINSQLTDLIYNLGFSLYMEDSTSTVLNSEKDYFQYGTCHADLNQYFVLHFAFVRDHTLLNVTAVCPKNDHEMIAEMDAFCKTIRFNP